ncbi:MAG: hypothetical protein V3S89_14655 [Desulfobacterales bacterium]
MSLPAQITHRLSIGICFLILFLAPAPLAQAEEVVAPRVVITTGTGLVYREDVQSARRQAIASSLVSAVAQVSFDLIPLDTMSRDFQILNNILFSRTNEFIQDYKVLNSARSGNRYSVMVQASVSTEQVESQLSGVGILLLKNMLPRVLFFVTETTLSDPFTRYWWGAGMDAAEILSQNMMSLVLEEKGFLLVDPNLLSQDPAVKSVNYRPYLSRQEMISLGAYFQADVVIIGTSTAKNAPNRMGDTIGSYEGEVHARAFRTDTGALVGETKRSFVSVSDDVADGSADALSGAGQLAGVDLAGQLVAAWQDKTKSLTGITVRIKWWGDLANLVELRQAIAAIPGTKGIFPREMTADETVVAVDFEGNEKALADALMVHLFSSFGIHILEMSDLHLSIELTSPEAVDLAPSGSIDTTPIDPTDP